MKQRLLLGLAVLFAGFFLLMPGVHAAASSDPLRTACSQGAQDSSLCKDTSADNPIFGEHGVITRATQLVSTAVGAVAVFMIIIGGFKYITSSGDASNVESAKNTILFAIVGLVIALVAQGIVLFVLKEL